MRGSVTRTWLAMCAAFYAAGIGCNSSSSNLPPIEATGMPGESCQLGSPCQNAGAYCIGSGEACKYLECLNGSWQCPPDGGAVRDAGMTPPEAGAGLRDAASD